MPSLSLAVLLLTFAIPFNVFLNFNQKSFGNILPPDKPLPTPTIIPTVLPTLIPKPIIKFLPTLTPTTPSPTAINSIRDYILNAINNYRTSKGLPLVHTDPNTCGFAKTRAKEISTSFNHDGFNNRVSSKTLPYPSYSLITENLDVTANYKDVVNMWINSQGHATNMQKDTLFVCVANYGNYYAYEGWKP